MPDGGMTSDQNLIVGRKLDCLVGGAPAESATGLLDLVPFHTDINLGNELDAVVTGRDFYLFSGVT